MVSMYLFIAVPVANLNYQLDTLVQALDRNDDGLISPDEEITWSDTAKRADYLWAADGGRNVFGYLLSPIFAAVYTTGIFAVFYLAGGFMRKLKDGPISQLPHAARKINITKPAANPKRINY